MTLSRILKHTLTIEAEQRLSVPEGARPLTVQLQNGTPTLWLLTRAPDHGQAVVHEDWLIRCVGTGWEVWGLDEWTYLGTVQDAAGYVWHFFRQEAA